MCKILTTKLIRYRTCKEQCKDWRSNCSAIISAQTKITHSITIIHFPFLFVIFIKHLNRWWYFPVPELHLSKHLRSKKKINNNVHYQSFIKLTS